MKKSTLEVIQREIELTRRRVETFRDGLRKNSDDEHWRNIYQGLVTIFESYDLTFRYILLEEGIQGSPNTSKQESEVTTSTESLRRTVPKAGRKHATAITR